MLSQLYFPFPVLTRKTIFFQKKFQISCVYYFLSQRVLYLMTVKLQKLGKNILEEINSQSQRIVSKNTCFQQILTGAEKKSKDSKRIWKTQG